MAKQNTQSLANVRLKLDRIGSNVLLRNVTPAELMFLVADHHINAGGKPVEELHECDEAVEQEALKKAQAELADLQKKLEALNEIELTDEIRQRRSIVLMNKIKAQDSIIARLQGVAQLRRLSPLQERRRLSTKYGSRRIARFYSGQFPQLPSSFEEACESGTNVSTTGEKLMVVGATNDQDYLINT